MVKVIDNFLSEKEYTDIYTLLTNEYFPWYFNNYKLHQDTPELFKYQFIHSFYSNYNPNSDLITHLHPLIKKLNPLALIRIKANLNPIGHKLIEGDNHVDQFFKSKAAIYYVNSNNGYTKIGDKKVKSKSNRIVLFDAEIKHYGTNSTDCNNRMLINFNYF